MDDCLRWIDQHITSALAVGEIGLDYDKRLVKVAPKELQKEVLGRLLQIARRHSRPAIIHTRYAWRDALSLVLEAGLDRAVFHWFAGFFGVLKDIIAGGFSFLPLQQLSIMRSIEGQSAKHLCTNRFWRQIAR